jgi:phenylalanyl-tRNA synthetase beta subunit
VIFSELPKFPLLRRDLALLVDQPVKFSQICGVALKTERQILREVNLFDVYEGKGILRGKNRTRLVLSSATTCAHSTTNRLTKPCKN